MDLYWKILCFGWILSCDATTMQISQLDNGKKLNHCFSRNVNGFLSQRHWIQDILRYDETRASGGLLCSFLLHFRLFFHTRCSHDMVVGVFSNVHSIISWMCAMWSWHCDCQIIAKAFHRTSETCHTEALACTCCNTTYNTARWIRMATFLRKFIIRQYQFSRMHLILRCVVGFRCQ